LAADLLAADRSFSEREIEKERAGRREGKASAREKGKGSDASRRGRRGEVVSAAGEEGDRRCGRHGEGHEWLRDGD
jgi:hypothetical protein